MGCWAVAQSAQYTRSTSAYPVHSITIVLLLRTFKIFTWITYWCVSHVSTIKNQACLLSEPSALNPRTTSTGVFSNCPGTVIQHSDTRSDYLQTKKWSYMTCWSMTLMFVGWVKEQGVSLLVKVGPYGFERRRTHFANCEQQNHLTFEPMKKKIMRICIYLLATRLSYCCLRRDNLASQPSSGGSLLILTAQNCSLSSPWARMLFAQHIERVATWKLHQKTRMSLTSMTLKARVVMRVKVASQKQSSVLSKVHKMAEKVMRLAHITNIITNSLYALYRD